MSQSIELCIRASQLAIRAGDIEQEQAAALAAPRLCRGHEQATSNPPNISFSPMFTVLPGMDLPV